MSKKREIEQGTMKRKIIFRVFLFAFILFIAKLVIAADIPDPAAAYAEKLGYKYEIRADGSGMVIFPNGTECNAWDFFRGKSGQEWSYCERHGGKVENRSEDMGTWKAEYAVCVFPDGSECSEADYVDGKSGPGIYKKWSLDIEKRK